MANDDPRTGELDRDGGDARDRIRTGGPLRDRLLRPAPFPGLATRAQAGGCADRANNLPLAGARELANRHPFRRRRGSDGHARRCGPVCLRRAGRPRAVGGRRLPRADLPPERGARVAGLRGRSPRPGARTRRAAAPGPPRGVRGHRRLAAEPTGGRDGRPPRRGPGGPGPRRPDLRRLPVHGAADRRRGLVGDGRRCRPARGPPAVPALRAVDHGRRPGIPPCRRRRDGRRRPGRDQRLAPPPGLRPPSRGQPGLVRRRPRPRPPGAGDGARVLGPRDAGVVPRARQPVPRLRRGAHGCRRCPPGGARPYARLPEPRQPGRRVDPTRRRGRRDRPRRRARRGRAGELPPRAVGDPLRARPRAPRGGHRVRPRLPSGARAPRRPGTRGAPGRRRRAGPRRLRSRRVQPAAVSVS